MINTDKKFHKNVISFAVDNISMIGNSENGVFLGLDKTGESLVSKIRNKNEGFIEIKETDMKLYEALVRNDFFENEDNKNNLIDSVYLHVTGHCNLHCTGCYSYVTERNKNENLSFEQICKILDQLKTVGVKKIVISGGEPFIRKDFKDICKYANKLGFLLLVITNGTMKKDAYKEVIPFINEISVSIDGYDNNTYFIRDKGIMPQVLDTINYLKDKIETKIIVTLHKKNIDYMNEYFLLSQKMNVFFSFSILTAEASNESIKEYLLDEDDFDKMFQYLKEQKSTYVSSSQIDKLNLKCKMRCEAGRKHISIGADGSIYPCHMMHFDELKLGNILDNDIKEIVFTKENPFIELDVNSIDSCKDCKYKYFCGSNCRARGYLYNKSIYEKDDMCKIIYKLTESNFEELKKMCNL